jgi:hypothetical protein
MCMYVYISEGRVWWCLYHIPLKHHERDRHVTHDFRFKHPMEFKDTSKLTKKWDIFLFMFNFKRCVENMYMSTCCHWNER